MLYNHQRDLFEKEIGYHRMCAKLAGYSTNISTFDDYIEFTKDNLSFLENFDKDCYRKLSSLLSDMSQKMLKI